MNLISCEVCGLVYDIERIDIPDCDDYDEDNPEQWSWQGERFVPVLNCACGEKTPIVGWK